MQLPTSSSSERSTDQTSTPSAAKEYQGVLSDYDTLIANLNKPDFSLADLEGTSIVPHADTPLAHLGGSGRELLKPLLNNPQYRAHCQKSGANPDSLVLTVDDNRVKYELTTGDGKRKLTMGLPASQLKFATDKNGQPALVVTPPEWANLIVSINQAAIKMGGEIRSDGAIKLVQMLTYYGTSPWHPKIATEHRATIHALEEKRARYSLQLDSGVDIDALNRAPTDNDRKILKAIQRATPNTPMTMERLIAQLTIRDMTEIVKRFLPETETSLLGYLEKNTSPRANAEQVRATPMVFLEKILRSAESERLGNALLEGLSWYGSKPGEDASAGVRIKLISKAIRLWADLSKSNKPEDIAGYPWHQRSNWGKSYQSIWAEFEQHLFDSKRASSTTEASLLARLFQPEFPSDYQVCDVPADLPYRSSVVWVNFVHGVTLVDAMEPGLVQRMTFQQLVDFPLQQSLHATAKEQEFLGLSRTPPTLEWAITNDIILERTDSDYSQEEIDQSIKALDEHSDALRKAIIQLDVHQPTRAAIAEREMKKYFKDALLIGHEGTPVKPIGPSSVFISDGRKLIEDFGHVDGGGLIQTPPLKDKIYSFRDVYMSGRLTENKTWFITTKDGIRKSKHRISINADRTIKTTAPWLPATLTQKPLPDTEKLFDTEFNNYLGLCKSAYQTLLNSQFASLPYDDRQAIEKGEVKIYTLRKSTRKMALKDETPKITLPLRLRMGFILQITYKTKASYYECLPRAGIIRRCANFSSAMLNGRTEALNMKESLLGDIEVIAVRRGKTVPFDWNAHEFGNLPKENATCEAIIDQFGETFTAPSLSSDSEQSSPATAAFFRASELANFIANKFFYFDEELLRSADRGETEIERIAAHPHWLDSVRGFIPFWGSISDLLSGDPKKKTRAIFGLIVDALSFAYPLGKFVSGSLKLVSTAVRSGIRTALPKFATLTQKLLISTIQNVIPFYGVPTLALRLSRGLLRGLYTGVKFVVKKSFNSLKTSLGSAGKYSFIEGLPQVTDPGRWIPLTHGDRLATLHGLEDVPVRNIGSTSKPAHYLIDPVSAKPYGHVLNMSENELSIGPSLYPTVGKNSDSLLFNIPENTRVREVLEVDGRTTVFIDDVPYRLDGDSLRRVSSLDASETLRQVPCRIRRAPGDICKTKYVIADAPADTPTPGSFTEDKGWAPWFGDSAVYPSNPNQAQRYGLLAYEGKIYQHTETGLKPYKGKPEWLGLTQKHPVIKASIPAKMQFQRGIYGRLQFTGTADKIDDIHDVGAIIVYSKDKTKKYVFARINTDDYYMAELLAKDDIQSVLTMKLLTEKQPLVGTLHEELLRVYTGSLNANNTARIHGVDKLERALKKMEEIAIPIGTPKNPPDNMVWLSVDTTSSEALMFDHQTRLIVCELPDGAALWKTHTGAPAEIQKSTADIFERLFTDTTIPITTPSKPTADAVKIDQAMERLQGLLPQNKRTQNLRNIAFAELHTATGRREIYVSVSGGGDNTRHLPLFKSNSGYPQVELDSTTYFNIDNAKTPIEPSSLHMSSDNKLLAIPHITNDPNRSDLLTRATSADSESKLIGYIGEKYPDSKDIRSITLTTTLPPCDSCSIVMKEFGHERGASALNVTWGNRSNPLKRKIDDTSSGSGSSSSPSTSSSSSD